MAAPRPQAEKPGARQSNSDRLLELANDFRLGAETVYRCAGTGIAFSPYHGEDMVVPAGRADPAVNGAKNSGGNRFVIYHDS